ncbi:hypothetical protein QTV49_001669 [Vibrio vulnificus]|nr:hypothetical protein [Vibrio vulnificus]
MILTKIIEGFKSCILRFGSKNSLKFVIVLSLLHVLVGIGTALTINISQFQSSYQSEELFSSMGYSCLKNKKEIDNKIQEGHEYASCDTLLKAQEKIYFSDEKEHLKQQRELLGRDIASYLMLNKSALINNNTANWNFAIRAMQYNFDEQTNHQGMSDEAKERSLKTLQTLSSVRETSNSALEVLYNSWILLFTPIILYAWLVCFFASIIIRKKLDNHE